MTSKKKTLRTIIALILTLILVGTIIPTTAFAAEADTDIKTEITDTIVENTNFIDSLLIQIRDFIKSITTFFKSLFCKKTEEPPVIIPVESVTADKSVIKLGIGGTDKITATVNPENAVDTAVTFASSDEAVATVDAEGNVTAIAAGNATITITSVYDETKQATVEVAVYTKAVSTFTDISRSEDGNYVLTGDIASDKSSGANGTMSVAIDLNGNNFDASAVNNFAFLAQNGGKLHLTGDGTVNMTKGFCANKGNAEITIDGGTYITTTSGTLNNIKHASLAQNNSKIIINDGTFISEVEDSVIFFATSNAIIEINGGFFENTADDTPDLLGIGTNKYNTNRIIIKGGTFVNYNPLEDQMCYKGSWEGITYESFVGPWILIWEGYTVVAETQENGDIWYSVVPVA